MLGIYKHLLDELKQEDLVVWDEAISSQPPPITSQEPLTPSQADSQPDTLEKPSETSPIAPENPHIDIPAPPIGFRPLAVVLGVGLILIVVLFFVFSNGDTPQIAEVPTIEPTITPTFTLAPTDTPIPTDTIQAVVVPTDTIPPTATIPPTNTPLPTDTLIPISIDFEDDFSDGLADGWEVLSGEPLILNQRYLTPSGDELFIAYGEQNWTDYQVEVGVESAACGIRGNYIAVRLTDFSMVAFVFSGCGGSFYEYDGEWRRIDSTIYNKGSLQGTTVKVVVSGNEITGFVKGVAVASITTGFPNGRVGLKIQKDSAISFFKVSTIR